MIMRHLEIRKYDRMQSINGPRFDPQKMGPEGMHTIPVRAIIIILFQILTDDSGKHIHMFLVNFVSTNKETIHLFLCHNFVNVLVFHLISEDTLQEIMQSVCLVKLIGLANSQIWTCLKWVWLHIILVHPRQGQQYLTTWWISPHPQLHANLALCRTVSFLALISDTLFFEEFLSSILLISFIQESTTTKNNTLIIKNNFVFVL